MTKVTAKKKGIQRVAAARSVGVAGESAGKALSKRELRGAKDEEWLLWAN